MGYIFAHMFAKNGAVGTPWLVAGALALAMVTSSSSAARLYQWTNPRTGVPELSGTAPGWYRSDSDGPAVRVYEAGRLIDDTRFRVTPEKQQTLRSAAFSQIVNEDPALHRLEQAVERAEPSSQTAVSVTEVKPDSQAEQGLDADRGPLGEMGAETIARLKALIAEFDRGSSQ